MQTDTQVDSNSSSKYEKSPVTLEQTSNITQSIVASTSVQQSLHNESYAPPASSARNVVSKTSQKISGTSQIPNSFSSSTTTSFVPLKDSSIPLSPKTLNSTKGSTKISLPSAIAYSRSVTQKEFLPYESAELRTKASQNHVPIAKATPGNQDINEYSLISSLKFADISSNQNHVENLVAEDTEVTDRCSNQKKLSENNNSKPCTFQSFNTQNTKVESNGSQSLEKLHGIGNNNSHSSTTPSTHLEPNQKSQFTPVTTEGLSNQCQHIIPPNSSLLTLPPHVLSLLLKCHVSPNPCRLSPFKYLLVRHPLHRDSVETHISSLISTILANGFNEAQSSLSPLFAVQYVQSLSLPTWAGANIRATVHAAWNDRPLMYIVGGAARSEAMAHLLRYEPEHPNTYKKGLQFYIIDGNKISPWEVFLLSVSLNALDENSRATNYFERTDQLAFVAFELAQRQQHDVTCCDIAVEICFNQFLEELREPLRLSPDMIPLQSLTEPNLLPTTKLLLLKSRDLFPCLPVNYGVILSQIQSSALEVLDVLIDMATCVNSDRIKYFSTTLDSSKQKRPSVRTEGFLHAVAEDQLRHLFRDIVPISSAATFDVLMLRDMVSIVFGAIQECSRQFRLSVNKKEDLLADSDITSSNLVAPATNKAAATYWIERIVYEASPGGLLAGMWNFPAAALVTLFYVYFVNEQRQFDRQQIQKNILRVGTVLYRCVAELALTLRVSKISLMTAPISTQIRVLEGVSILFRFALFGSVDVEMLPIHPYAIPVEVLCIGNPKKPAPVYHVKTFSDPDSLYQFLYSYWFKGLIVSNHHQLLKNLVPQQLFALRTAAEVQQNNSAPNTLGDQYQIKSARVGLSWIDSRRADVTATINRIKQEIETTLAQGGTSDRIRLKRLGKRVQASHAELRQATNASDLVDVEILDPSILPMASAARLEFVTLIYGVVSMLIERYQQSESGGLTPAGQNDGQLTSTSVRVLTVPANMVVLAAIKVALSFISPHFDKLAPYLTHWITTRTRLILWIWKTTKEELTWRAEECWTELWKQQTLTSTPPKLKVCFVTGQRSEKQGTVELSTNKLGEVISAVLPDVLESMVLYYEEQSSNNEISNDEHIMREFFARWLKSASDTDLIARVNTILAAKTREVPTPSSPSFQYAHEAVQSNGSKKIRSPFTSDTAETVNTSVLPTSAKTVYTQAQQLPIGVASSRPSGTPNDINVKTGISSFLTSRSGVPLDSLPSSKKARKSAGTRVGVSADDDYNEWLESLPFAERQRLDSQELPKWDITTLSMVSASDLIRWKPPDASYNQFVGSGISGPVFDDREWRRFKRKRVPPRRIPCCGISGVQISPRILPLSDLDWKIVKSVLILLRSRGVDILASRGRGQIFFLDQMLNYTDALKQRLFAHQTNHVESMNEGRAADQRLLLLNNQNDEESIPTVFEEQLRHPPLKKSAAKKFSTSTEAALQKRYGAQFFKKNLLDVCSEDHMTSRIHDIDSIRAFLEYDDLNDKF